MNPRRPKALENFKQQLALDRAHRARAGDIAGDGQGDAFRLELAETHVGRRFLQNAFVLGVGVIQQVLHLLRVDVQRQQQFQTDHPLGTAAQGDVAQVLRDQL